MLNLKTIGKASFLYSYDFLHLHLHACDIAALDK